MRPRGRSNARLVLTLFALLAFVLQAYLTQTHIHISAQADAAISLHDAGVAPIKAPPSQDRDHFPAKDDPANCPLCQQITIAGAFVSPTATGLLLPLQVQFAAPTLYAVSIVLRSISHSWRGRAPPHA
ncbi:MAG: DUF2946 family protein [Rhizomicrobium sp.]